jgi:hypothetical protein
MLFWNQQDSKVKDAVTTIHVMEKTKLLTETVPDFKTLLWAINEKAQLIGKLNCVVLNFFFTTENEKSENLATSSTSQSSKKN